MKRISYYPLSFVGRRDGNQDNCLSLQLTSQVYLFAVADGMGGKAGGEIASKIAIETLAAYYQTEPILSSLDTLTLKESLKIAYQKVDEGIRKKAKEQPELNGMGTTLTTLLVWKDHYAVANIGDSRLYLMDSDSISQITSDHSLVQEYIDKNDGEEIDVDVMNSYSHVLTKCLDGSSEEPDLFPTDQDAYQLHDNEVFLICSDGLIEDKVNTNIQLLRNYAVGFDELKLSAENLIAYAFHRGSTDNITVLLVEIGSYPRTKESLKQYAYPPSENGTQGSDETVRHKKLSGRLKAFITLTVILIILAGTYFVLTRYFEMSLLNSITPLVVPRN